MKSLWLEPDYAQSGIVWCDEAGVKQPAHEALPLATLPRALVLGIPEEILAIHVDDEFVFAQFCRSDEENYFACSIRAGADISGRTVTLTHLQRLARGESPKIPPEASNTLHGNASAAMRKLIDVLAKDSPARAATYAMLAAVASQDHLRSFANVWMQRSANPPSWMPQKKKRAADSSFKL